MNQEIKENFMTVMRRLKKIGMKFPQNMDVSMTEMLVLKGFFCPKESVGQAGQAMASEAEIHEKLHVSKAALSQTLNALEKKEYVERCVNPQDRRKVLVTLTPSGKKMMDDSHAYVDRVFSQVIERVGEDKIRELIGLFETVIAISEEVQAELTAGSEYSKDENEVLH